MNDTGRQQLLKYAEERIGRTELALQLKVTESTVEAWINGSEMPSRKVLLLADLIDSLGQGERK